MDLFQIGNQREKQLNEELNEVKLSLIQRSIIKKKLISECLEYLEEILKLKMTQDELIETGKFEIRFYKLEVYLLQYGFDVQELKSCINEFLKMYNYDGYRLVIKQKKIMYSCIGIHLLNIKEFEDEIIKIPKDKVKVQNFFSYWTNPEQKIE